MEKPTLIEELRGEARPADAVGSRLRGASIAAAVAALVIVVVVGAAWAGTARRAEAAAIESEEGAYKVHYTIQTTPTSSEGSMITNVSRIEFHPGYVVVQRREGGGHVFFNEHTLSLSWSR